MMDEPWPGLREPRRPGNEKTSPLCSRMRARSPGWKWRSFLQEAEREKPGNKSVDGRV